MSPEQIEIERKAFEAHLSGEGRLSVDRDSENSDWYEDFATQDTWLGWLARAEKAQRVREALERVLKSFPTDTDMHAAGWETLEVEEACSAYDAARAALKEDTHG